MSFKKQLKYIYAYCSQGQSKYGVDRGPNYIRKIDNKSSSNIFIKKDKFIGKPIKSKKWKPYQSYYINWDGYNLIRNNVFNVLKNNEKPIILGGDHSISLGSVAGALDFYKNDLTVIWIDAHADINTKKTSPSGNLHGMPLSYLSGLESSEDFKIKHTLDLSNLIYIGIRDLDPFEEEIIDKYKIQHITSKQLRQNTLKQNLNNLSINTNNIHMSVDVDVLDPLYMPCTGTLVNDGIDLNMLLGIIKYINKKNNVVSTDLVELNPNINSKNFYFAIKNCNKILDSIKEDYD